MPPIKTVVISNDYTPEKKERQLHVVLEFDATLYGLDEVDLKLASEILADTNYNDGRYAFSAELLNMAISRRLNEAIAGAVHEMKMRECATTNTSVMLAQVR